VIKNELRQLIGRLTGELRAPGGTSKEHQQYMRFIMLGRSRTGSNFLRGLLNRHSRIRVLGEVYRNFDAIDWDYPGYPEAQKVLPLYQSDPVRFLETHVFGSVPQHVAAVGFKLFYYHAPFMEQRALWEHLRAQQDIRIIHVKRANILRTHLSRQRALVTDNWVNTSGAPPDEAPLTLSYEECRKDFERTREWETQYDAFFAGHPKLDVVYEQLDENPAGELCRVQTFLGVPEEPAAPSTYRQSAQPLSKSIANYRELKERFAGSPWESFFED
jgi:LPS sulfotransferase NodH